MRYKAVQINLTQLSKEKERLLNLNALPVYKFNFCQTLLQRRVGFALGWQKRGRF